MDREIQERIIKFNKQFGLETEFITDESILGYSLNNTIYINSNLEHDYERSNKHELLHFFEETPEFEKVKAKVLEANKENLEELRAEYELRYFGLYSEAEIYLEKESRMKKGILFNFVKYYEICNNSSKIRKIYLQKSKSML